MSRRSWYSQKLRAARSRIAPNGSTYDPATHGLYELGSEIRVPAGQSIYDPNVFGRYDLSTQRVAPKDPGDDGVWSRNFDLLMASAQRHVSHSGIPVVADRYTQVLALLSPGSGICLDACTSSPEDRVRIRVTELGYEYLPIDIDGDGQRVRREDLTRLSFDDNSIACAMSLDTLEHIDDYRAALREIRRVLAPAAPLILHVPCYYIDRESSVPTTPGIDPWEHVRYFSARELLDAVIDAGLLLLRCSFQLDYGALLAVAVKPA